MANRERTQSALTGHNNAPGRRILVVGTSGCGKSYLARCLAEGLGIPYISNDQLIWGPNWTLFPRAQRLAAFDLATRGDGWTLDGNPSSTDHAEHALMLGRADTVVWLDLPLFEVMRQVLVRTIIRAWMREPLWHGNAENWRMSFASRDSILLWAWTTFDKRRRQYRALFADPRWAHLRRIRLCSRAAVHRWLAAHVRQA